jgi:CHAD domain-containing protein
MQHDATAVVTFSLAGNDPAAAIDRLGDLGFEFGPQQTVTTMLVDTFDGRLHAAGLRLEVRRSDGLELVLSGPGTVPAHLAVTKAPKTLSDLPPGPFRARIAALTDVRALVAQIRVRMARSTGVWRDATGKTVVIAEVNEGVHALGRPHADRSATIEIHPVPGYAKQAGRAVEALREHGLEPGGRDTLAQGAAGAGVDLAGFRAVTSIPLDRRMPAIDGFRAVLANLEVSISANWQGAIDQTDTKFLHDLRIAVRRTRTVLAAAKTVIPPSVLEPATVGFAWLAGGTGTPRDLDVYLLEWDHYVEPLDAAAAAALTPVHDLLGRHHTESHRDLEQALRSERAAELIAGWRQWLHEPLPRPADGEPLPRRADHPLGRVVAKRIARAHSSLVEDGRQIGPDSPAEQVHDLRKDAKKLRYLVECFGSLLPEKPRKRYVRQLKALQENLGEHQDAEVHIEMLQSLTVELDESGTAADTLVAIGQLTERLDQTRITARAEFADRFADYDSPATQRALDAMLEAIAR